MLAVYCATFFATIGCAVSYYHQPNPPAAGEPARIGVLLVNLGTPDALSWLAVARYLREFLADRRVIDAPRALWYPLLFGFVLPLRSARTLRKYRVVWMAEGSPLAVLSDRLARKVAVLVAARHDDALRVELAMTYGRPDVDQALAKLAAANVNRLLVLPLYPQYCASTTGAVFDRVARSLRRRRSIPETRFVNDYHAEPSYVRAVADSIRQSWARAGSRSHLLLSFHGIPEEYVSRGDPYRRQAEATAALVGRELGLAEGDFTVAYQSRFGPTRWLQPYTADSLRALAARGVREVTVASPSFAVDCLETLEEIGLEYRDMFARLGGRLTLVPALNDGEAHVEALLAVIERQMGGWL